jgi:hypothetical protein
MDGWGLRQARISHCIYNLYLTMLSELTTATMVRLHHVLPTRSTARSRASRIAPFMILVAVSSHVCAVIMLTCNAVNYKCVKPGTCGQLFTGLMYFALARAEWICSQALPETDVVYLQAAGHITQAILTERRGEDEFCERFCRDMMAWVVCVAPPLFVTSVR